MAKRTRVNCEKCNSFLHETKDCDAEKVLGFKKKDAYFYVNVIDAKYNTYKIPKRKLVPVVHLNRNKGVSVEELEEAFKDASDAIERFSIRSNADASYSAGQRCVILFLRERLMQAKKEAKK